MSRIQPQGQSLTGWRTQPINYTAGFDEVEAIGANPDRVALIFCSPVGAYAQFGIGDLLSYGGVVYSLESTQSIVLLYRDLGEIIRAAWRSTSNAALAVGSVTEVYLLSRTAR